MRIRECVVMCLMTALGCQASRSKELTPTILVHCDTDHGGKITSAGCYVAGRKYGPWVTVEGHKHVYRLHNGERIAAEIRSESGVASAIDILANDHAGWSIWAVHGEFPRGFAQGATSGHSLSVIFWSNGGVQCAGWLEAGSREGRWQYFTQEGRQYLEGDFHSGQRIGNWTAFEVDGTPHVYPADRIDQMYHPW